MKELSITALIPTKNRKALLGRALKSVFDQTVLLDEIIVVNDGSTDGTKEYLDNLCKDHPNLKAIHRGQSGGVNAARNHGTKEAKSEWIAWLDDDDEFLPDAIEKIKNRLSSVPETCHVAYFNTFIIRSAGSFEGGYQLEEGQEFYDLRYEDVMLIKYRLRGDCKSVIRRSLFVEDGYWLPESVNGFESYFFNLIARDGKGIRCYKDICTKIHQEDEIRDRLSIHAPKKNPWPLFVLHFKQLFQHCGFYITHPLILWKKKIDMAKLLFRIVFRIN